MQINLAQRTIPYVLLTLAVTFLSAGCAKRLSVLSSGPWLSEFATLSTPTTEAYASELLVFSAVDPSGNIYLSGTNADSWVVLKSSDGGTSWNEEFSHGAGSAGFQITSDSLGNIFAVGATGGYPYYGTIKKFDVGTGLWSTVHSFRVQTGKLTMLEAVAVDSSGHIYVAGEATVTLLSPDGWPDMDVTKLIVLKSTDHGSTWNTVDAFALDDYGFTRGTGLLVASSGDVYVFGRAQGSSRQQNVVRKSTDGGATWTRVYEDFGSSLRGLAEWNGGLIVNEDYFGTSNNPLSGRVRGTTDTFGQMKILDSLTPNETVLTVTGFMRTDALGRVYYPVQYADEEGILHVALRGTRGDGVWETLDDYSVPLGDSLHVAGVLIGLDGSVYNIATHSTSSGATWILRKATALSAESATAPSMGGGTDLISPVPAGAKRIFLTHQLHDGFWGATAASAIANADSACNSDSNKPLVDSSATYKALLVSSVRRACSTPNCGGGASENLDWVFAPGTNYVSREGAALGTTNSSGLFTAFNRALLTNSVDWAWTGLETTDRNWTVEPGADSCGDWTTNDSGSWSTFWTPRGTEFGDIYTENGWMTCERTLRLICVEQ